MPSHPGIPSVVFTSRSLSALGLSSEECEEDDIEFLETGEDEAEAFQSPEESFDLIAFLVEGAIVLPRMQPVGLGRDHRNHDLLLSSIFRHGPVRYSILGNDLLG
jgi:hypothetical protein